MAFLTSLKELKPSRRTIFCRLHALRKRIRYFAKTRCISRREILRMLYRIMREKWTHIDFIVFTDTINDVFNDVCDILRMCTADVKRLLWYLAGLMGSNTVVNYLNKLCLRYGQHAAA
jgi:hypothetical protein